MLKHAPSAADNGFETEGYWKDGMAFMMLVSSLAPTWAEGRFAYGEYSRSALPRHFSFFLVVGLLSSFIVGQR